MHSASSGISFGGGIDSINTITNTVELTRMVIGKNHHCKAYKVNSKQDLSRREYLTCDSSDKTNPFLVVFW